MDEEKAANAVSGAVQKKIESMHKKFDNAKKEIAKAVVGQEEIVDRLLESLLAKGHVLLEGVPGIGKTLVMRTVSAIFGGNFSRIQFTPDLLPSDIVGVTSYTEKKGFFTVKGPVFANIVLGDEINRAPPKVQSALLQAMQEKEVTIGKDTIKLPAPFFVMATQNPLDHIGTYKLPEAQMDRFLFKLFITYPQASEEQVILEKNITLERFEDMKIKKTLTAKDLVEAQHLLDKMYVDDKIKEYLVRLVDATRYPDQFNLELTKKYVAFGASPRGSISLFVAAKAHAFLQKRYYVTLKDVKDIALPVLRHRIIINFEGQAEGITSDDIIEEILQYVELM